MKVGQTGLQIRAHMLSTQSEAKAKGPSSLSIWTTLNDKNSLNATIEWARHSSTSIISAYTKISIRNTIIVVIQS